MKLYNLIVWLFLFSAVLNVAAQQVEPKQIDQGSIQISKYSSVPETEINVTWAFSGNSFSSSLTSGPRRPGVMPTLLANRPLANYTIIAEPSDEARGNIVYHTVSFTNSLLWRQSEPLSTRFELKLDNFRVPRFPKVDPPAYIDVYVPFTMTGRVSSVGLEGTPPYIVIPVTGSGQARLRFQRIAGAWQRVQLTNAYFSFSPTAP
jgi:hypothetical protein